MSNKIFKKGDRVYSILSGWGTVDKFKHPGDFPMTVEFDNGNNEQYTIDGRFYFNSPPILSFTEYTLSGFSQEACQNIWVTGCKDIKRSSYISV